MLNYKYVPNPKLGDLVGYVLQGRDIKPAVIVGFSKQGNIQIVFLEQYPIKVYKTPKAQRGRYDRNPTKSVAKNHLRRVVLVDHAALDQKEQNLYDWLVNNKPLP